EIKRLRDDVRPTAELAVPLCSRRYVAIEIEVDDLGGPRTAVQQEGLVVREWTFEDLACAFRAGSVSRRRHCELASVKKPAMGVGPEGVVAQENAGQLVCRLAIPGRELRQVRSQSADRRPSPRTSRQLNLGKL